MIEALTLRDDLVVLRPPAERDVVALVAACNDPEIVRFTPIPAPYHRADAEAFLTMSREGLANGDAFSLVVADTLRTNWLGRSCSRSPDGALVRLATGQVPKRAVQALRAERPGSSVSGESTVLDLSESNLAFPDNVASERVAEKAGFVREGVLRSYRSIRGERRDLVSFSLLPSDLGE